MEKISFSGTKKAVFYQPSKKIKQEAVENTQKETKDGNKKLKLALTALGIAGAAITIGILIRQNKVNKLKDTLTAGGNNLTGSANIIGANNLTGGTPLAGRASEMVTEITSGADTAGAKLTGANITDSASLADTADITGIKPLIGKDGYIKNIITSKKGDITEEFSDESGNIIKRITNTADGRQFETSYRDGVKTVDMRGDNVAGFKVYTEEGGKLKKVGREYHDFSREYHKTVEQLDGGISKTTVRDGFEETITFRDKKGRIIDFESSQFPPKGGFRPDDIGPLDPGAEKIYERWYINYAALCKKYGAAMRPCGVEGGAWSHYYELLQREKGPEAWDKYLRLEQQRAQYDEKARLMQFLREFGSEDILKNLGFTKEDIDILVKMDSKTLKTLIKTMQEEGLSAKDVMSNMAEILERQKCYGYESVGDAAEEALNKLTCREAAVQRNYAETYEDELEEAYGSLYDNFEEQTEYVYA